MLGTISLGLHEKGAVPMGEAMILGKYSLGVGDRFAHQAEAQLRACMMAAEQGVEITPVWNKSHREHTIIGTKPSESRLAADAAVRKLKWAKPYFLDADHITMATWEGYAEACDFFTIDVAEQIGRSADAAAVEAFVARHADLAGELAVPGIDDRLRIGRDTISQVAAKYLAAVKEAGRIYRRVEETKGRGRFVTEVSMDETDAPQTPVELLIILAAIADEGVPIQTIAPKFTGRFNKGCDYVGDVGKFSTEFRDDVAAIAFAVKRYDLPGNLKLSVHSGSDKFSIYGPMRRVLSHFDAGVHLKTAGTTWLEELIGLAEGGGRGLALAKEIYAQAYNQRDALCAPYASVIDIDAGNLPDPAVVNGWSSGQFASALRHDPRCPDFNADLRQLLHVGFKVAAKLSHRYYDLLSEYHATIAGNVTGNLYDRHIRPLFLQ
jgi:tagaturonate epimerase